MTTSHRILTVDETDELIVAASTPEDDAIENCEWSPTRHGTTSRRVPEERSVV